MATKKTSKKTKRKKNIEPKTTTFGAELVFHIGESSDPDEFPSDIEVGVIVGVLGASVLKLGIVKSINPLVVIAEDGEEITPKERGSYYKLLGRLMLVDNEHWLPNRHRFFDLEMEAAKEMRKEAEAQKRAIEEIEEVDEEAGLRAVERLNEQWNK